jgi:hypothetical protein
VVISAFKIVVGKPERKKPFGTYKWIWKSNVKVELNNLKPENPLNNI